jgi:hypothetical protein
MLTLLNKKLKKPEGRKKPEAIQIMEEIGK